MFYGLVNQRQLVDYAVAVCDVIGHSTGFAVHMCVETCAAETLLGSFRDPTVYSAGTGVAQVDRSTFDWLKDAYDDHRHGKAIAEKFGIHLKKVRYEELETSPLLAMIFCRLRYYAAKGSIPETREGRALYWKKWYNSYDPNAKGTPEGYIDKCIKCNTDQVIKQYYM